MADDIRNLIYLVQCQFCLLCDEQKECKLDSNYGSGETKLVEDCEQSTFAGEDR
jgi:hypothetical protein